MRHDLRVFTSLTSAALLSAGALAACTPQGSGSPTTSTSAPMAAGEGGEGGSEAGAAHATDALAGLSDAGRRAYRAAQIRGVLLAAQRIGGTDGASVVTEGLADTYDTDPGAYTAAGVDAAPVRAARSGRPADIQAALASVTIPSAPADAASIVQRLAASASGRYRVAHADTGVDPIGLHASLSAALGAQAAAEAAGVNRAEWASAIEAARRLSALWPATAAATPPSPTDVAAQESRLELALSSLQS